jgi:hypothetical protein
MSGFFIGFWTRAVILLRSLLRRTLVRSLHYSTYTRWRDPPPTSIKDLVKDRSIRNKTADAHWFADKVIATQR